jgi:AbrB family looped-hinge helix DNA binding protein
MRLTIKGQVTIPQQIRRRLDLSAGDQVEFAVDPDGRIVIEKFEPNPFQRVRKRAKRNRSPYTTDEYMALMRGEGDEPLPGPFELARRRRPIRGITTDELMMLTRGRA